jgi:uracil-DNA glycosylase family 4
MPPGAPFKPGCKRCPRLAGHLKALRKQYPEYHCRPVAPFGDPEARLLIVGLAPGLHGANASGRPFTGDPSGTLLFQTLHAFGFASQPRSDHADDGLSLQGCRVTNAVKCLPPENRPKGSEVINCNPYLIAEINALPRPALLIALGRIAHNATLRALDLKQRPYPFAHGALHPINDGLQLLDSYHCSRYNTQTGRLSEAMFHDIFRRAQELLTP